MTDLADAVREWLRPVPTVEQWGGWMRHTHSALTAVLDRHRSERYDEDAPPYCAECSGLAGYRVEAPCRTVCDIARSLGVSVEAVLAADDFERATRRLATAVGVDRATVDVARGGLLDLAAFEPSALASAAAEGDELVSLILPVPAPCAIELSSGTPHWERIGAYKCVGDGPFVVQLGVADASQPNGVLHLRLGRPHAVGAVVKVVEHV